MERALNTLARIGLAVMLAALGWLVGRGTARSGTVGSVTVTDTLWVAVHDTCWEEVAVNVLRTDTVRLARVVTEHDTLTVHDSVLVEVRVEQKTFVGENWRVTAHGYGLGLDEVWINRPTVYVTKTNTKTKRWAFNVGAQVGYGYTIHGASPYAGIGVAFGYTF